ncbi:type II secretion system F family protein [Frankia sp. R82]|nr:type II secretion system F family protein [Frankia sp. R82]
MVALAAPLGIGALVWLAAGPVAAMTATVVAGCLYRAARHTRRRRHAAQVRVQAEDFLATFSAELDSGGAPEAALRSAARGMVSDTTARGAATRAARSARTARNRTVGPARAGPRSEWTPLGRLAVQLADADDPSSVLCRAEAGSIRQLGIAYRVCIRAGARLSPVTEMLATLARADAVRAEELATALAGPRSSGRLVAALPVFGIALGSLAGASPLHTLLTTPAGVACLLLGGLADLVGLRWLRAFADGVERRAAPTAMDAAGSGDPAGVTRRGAGRRQARLLADLPLALDLIAVALRSGATLSAAFMTVGAANGGALGGQLRAAARALAAGADVPTACAELVAATRPRHRIDLLGRWVSPGPRGSPHARWPAMAQTAVTAFDRAHRSGARPAAALTRLAERARAEAHAETITAARRAGVLAVVPLGLCFLPAFLLLSVVPVVLGTLPELLPA